MKRLNLMALVIGVTILFSGCSKEDFSPPGLDPVDQEITSLKAAKVKRSFTGICTLTTPPNPGDNAWYDATDDWRVTGTTVWVQPDATIFGGTATLFVDAKNPHDENRGKWEMTWSGELDFGAEGVVIVTNATGIGVEGKVKGMEAKWTYTMNYIGTDFPNPENPTFFYAIEGNIVKPQGPIKKVQY